MTTRLTGRCAIVTGGAKRLGAAMTEALHAEGADVVIHHHRSVAAAASLAATLNARRPGSATTVGADLLASGAAQLIVEIAMTTFGRIDVLVNSASSFYPTPLGNIAESHWDDLIGTNLRAPLFLSQAAAPHLRQARGVIVNLVDIHAQRPLKHHPVYCIAKAGLAMLTKSLARELGPDVRVNGIAPGPILWPESGMEPALQNEIIDQTALKCSGAPEDIVRALLFLTAESPFVTGQIIAVDGGRSIGW
ncbi:MAG TPA: pteridine reductase [Steroidobacteraceae bacterium]|nr:pteridine reductase [Steroidobacteraceae bacterium]